MITPKLHLAMNEQIKHEIESAYIYLSMEAFFHRIGLDGMAQWMRVQTQEEMIHAMMFFDHLRNRNAAITLFDLKQLKTDWKSPLEAFKDAYAHEQFITGKINDLMKIALAESDFAALPLLNWFVNEQIEEEANTSKASAELELVGDDKRGLLMLDREMGARIFAYPANVADLGLGPTQGAVA
jgi:ferritin